MAQPTYKTKPYSLCQRDLLLGKQTLNQRVFHHPVTFPFPSFSQELMSWCWQQNPRLRPSFTQILDSIKDDMSADFRTFSFFYSAENKRRGSGEPSDAETDKLLEEEPNFVRPLSSTPNGSPPLAFGLGRDENQPTNFCHSNGKPRL